MAADGPPLPVEVTATGEDTALAGIRRLVADAQSSSSRAQRLADKAAALLFWFALGAAVITAIVWTLLGRPDDYWARASARYRTLSAAQLDAALRPLLDVDRFTWVVVGDAATVRPQLEQLGLPVEVRPAS